MKEQIPADNRNPDYWRRQITPETRQLAREAGELRDAAFQAIKSATPVDPESGEVGTFVRFAGGAHLRPVYQTQSGKEFFSTSN